MSGRNVLSRYKRALSVVEKWPLDPLKNEYRDMGSLLRKRIDIEFRQGEIAKFEDAEKCDKMLASLENIASNKYKDLYKTEWNGATTDNFEDAQKFVSDEMMDMLRENAEIGIIRRGINRVKEQFLPASKEQKRLS
ncbi:hypothetical protein DPMN_178114 [Dreissena polymorpha]|uniref:Mitochondrial nucleoid factor 1 n=1 Tax=Dreissena polymorpha TaxID=45954 RepID=A0A9D4EC99_DREPO|nr:hypothetical protein DPMN_178114 [Dreissena polymorpha]